MKSERRFDVWHVFVTLIALGICLLLISFASKLVEAVNHDTWAVVTGWSVILLLSGGAGYLVRDLWREFRLFGKIDSGESR